VTEDRETANEIYFALLEVRREMEKLRERRKGVKSPEVLNEVDRELEEARERERTLREKLFRALEDVPERGDIPDWVRERVNEIYFERVAIREKLRSLYRWRNRKLTEEERRRIRELRRELWRRARELEEERLRLLHPQGLLRRKPSGRQGQISSF